MRIISFLLLLSLSNLSCKSQSGKEGKQEVVRRAIPEADTLMNKTKWSVADYEKGMLVIKKLKEEDIYTLFNYVRNEGKQLFDHLTDYSQYNKLLTNKTDDEQFEICNGITYSANQLLKIFYVTEKMNGKLLLDHEIISCFIATMALNETAISIVNRKFPDKESLDEVRKQGLQKAQMGVFQMISGALMTIGSEHSLYRDEDILLLATFLKPYIVSVKPFLSVQYQKKVDEEMEKAKNLATDVVKRILAD